MVYLFSNRAGRPTAYSTRRSFPFFFGRQPELVYYFCTATHTILHALIIPLIYENETAFESNELENNRFRLIEMNMIIVIAARPRWNLFAVCVPRAILICEFYYY